jgi:SAM-dependent methyltransferase
MIQNPGEPSRQVADGPISACPACGGTFARCRKDWLFRCDRCQLLTSTLQAAPTHVLNEAARHDALETLRRANFREILDVLERRGLRRDARVLDVGCGHGWFLEQAALRGLRATGIDPDAAVAKIARTRSSSVLVGSFPGTLDPDDRFDAVVFNDVLEHLPDLPDVLAAAKTHLKPKGFLVVNLPLATGIFYRLASCLDRIGYSAPLERLWQVNFPSPHRFYFTARQVAQIAGRAGFRELERMALPSLDFRGLWRRLCFDRSRNLLSSLWMWPVLVAILPLLWVLPNDVGAHIFVRQE